MNVIWILPGFASNESDSTCIPPLQDLALALQQRKVNLTILSLDYPFEQKSYFWNGIKVYALGGANKKRFSRMLLLLRAWRLLISLINNQGVDIIHSFWLTWPAILGQQFCKKYKLPHLQTIMGQDAMKNKFYRLFDFKYSTIVNLTQFANERFYSALSRHSDAIIPFGLGQVFEEVVDRDIDLINVGSVTGLKNQMFFLKLVHQIHQFKPNIKAVVIGKFYDMHLIKEMKKFIVEKDLESNISLLNELPRMEIFKFMRRSKVLIHTSAFESQGMVMLEAIAHGCKVYSSGKGIHFNHELYSLLTDDLKENVNSIVSYLVKKEYPYGEKLISIEQTAHCYFELYAKRSKI